MSSGPTIPFSAHKSETPLSILVTGGAGFIGSHLCEALLERGEKVVCLDNFCDFYAPAIKRANLKSCLKHPDFTLLEADITDAEALDRVFDHHPPILVIHLAAMAGVRPSILNPELYARVNMLGTLNLLQACVKHRVTKLLFASSSSVYGNNHRIPFCETDSVDLPISPYAATKKAGELLCHTWHHLYNISILCLRFFTVYGPRQRPDLAIHKFLNLLLQGDMLPVYGAGDTSRDYTYIGDTIAGILSAKDYMMAHHGFEIINLGNDHSVSLKAMISTLEQVTGFKAVLDPQPVPDGDVLNTHADISKARRLLGYDPRTSFSEGIRLFWQWKTAKQSKE